MTDLHSHILPGIDDGCPTLNDSLLLLRQYEILGFTDIICTPHYIAGTEYNADNSIKNKLLKQLQDTASQQGIKVKLHRGNEAFVDPYLIKQINEQKVSLISKNNLLFELSFDNEVHGLERIIHHLMNAGVQPIIAHPERYHYVQADVNKIESLAQSGVRFQCNYGSAYGLYGSAVKETFFELARRNLIYYLGTDVHRPNATIIRHFRDAEKIIIQHIGTDNYHTILSHNDSLVGEQK